MQSSKNQKVKKWALVFILSGILLTVSDQTVYAAQAAVEESAAQENLIDEALTKEQADEIFNFIIQKIAEGGLDSEEAVREAIAEGEEEFQVFLTDDEKDKIVQIVDQFNAWGLDTEGLAKKAKELYDEYGMELLEHPEKAAVEVVKSSIDTSLKGIGDFVAGIGRGIRDFFHDSIKGFLDIF